MSSGEIYMFSIWEISFWDSSSWKTSAEMSKHPLEVGFIKSGGAPFAHPMSARERFVTVRVLVVHLCSIRACFQ